MSAKKHALSGENGQDSSQNGTPSKKAPKDQAMPDAEVIVANTRILTEWVVVEHRVGMDHYSRFRGILVGGGPDGAVNSFHETGIVTIVDPPGPPAAGTKITVYEDEDATGVVYELSGAAKGPKVIVDALGQWPAVMDGGHLFHNQVLKHVKDTVNFLRVNRMMGLGGEPINNFKAANHLRQMLVLANGMAIREAIDDMQAVKDVPVGENRRADQAAAAGVDRELLGLLDAQYRANEDAKKANTAVGAALQERMKRGTLPENLRNKYSEFLHACYGRAEQVRQDTADAAQAAQLAAEATSKQAKIDLAERNVATQANQINSITAQLGSVTNRKSAIDVELTSIYSLIDQGEAKKTQVQNEINEAFAKGEPTQPIYTQFGAAVDAIREAKARHVQAQAQKEESEKERSKLQAELNAAQLELVGMEAELVRLKGTI